jgi:hypothetical protein
MTKVELYPSERQLLVVIYDNGIDLATGDFRYTECYPRETGLAAVLLSLGLIEVDGELLPGQFFLARVTQKGAAVVEQGD